MANPKTYQFNLPSKGRPLDAPIPETWYPGIQPYWPGCTSKRSVNPISGIVAVVIHATAGGSSEGAVSVMKAGKASFHWLIPDEDEAAHGKLIWACAPEALAAWHVQNSKSHPKVNGGKKGVNNWSLGIEVVNTQQSSDTFSSWQVEVTAQLVRYCWAKYPNLKHVVSHARLDPLRRNDPGSLFPWDTFKALVLDGAEEVPFADGELAVHADLIEAGTDELCCSP